MPELLNTEGTAAVHAGPIPADATPENCPLKPTRGSIVIVRETPPHMRRKMIVPESVRVAGRAMMAEAYCLAVGDPEYHISGKLIDPPCKVGDRVLTAGVSSFSTHKTDASETIWEVLPFSAICAVVDKGSLADIPIHRGIQGMISTEPEVPT